MIKMNDHVDTIEKGIEVANNRDYENGMATDPVTVNLEDSYLKVIRKCGSMDFPEILLFKVVPKNDEFVNYSELSDEILEAIGIYGDISLEFQGNGPIKTIVIENI